MAGEVVNFGEALDWLKSGQRAHRAGWNGKGMYLLFVQPGDDCRPDPPPDPTYSVRGLDNDVNGCLPWIGMRTAGGDFVPWLASQTDILAEDWEIVQ